MCPEDYTISGTVCGDYADSSSVSAGLFISVDLFMSCPRYRRQSPIMMVFCPFVSIWHNVLNKLVSSAFMMLPLLLLFRLVLVLVQELVLPIPQTST